MDNMIYILFISIVTPLVLMSALVENKSKRAVIFVIVGCFVAVLSSEVNGLLAKLIPLDMQNFTVTVAPITEELIKAIPVLYFALVISDRMEDIITVALAVGIGFAVLENTYMLSQNIEAVTLIWAIMRGFGTGLMHGICTLLAGICFAFVRKRKKLFAVGTFALFSLSITYHSIFNMLVQSDFRYIGAAFPIITYLPFLVWRYKNKSKKIIQGEEK